MFLITIQSAGIPVSRLAGLVCKIVKKTLSTIVWLEKQKSRKKYFPAASSAISSINTMLQKLN